MKRLFLLLIFSFQLPFTFGYANCLAEKGLWEGEDISIRFFDDEFQISQEVLTLANLNQEPKNDSLKVYQDRALFVQEEVEKTQKFVTELNAKTAIDLPVGIRKTIGVLNYTILIDSIVITPVGSFLIAYMVFEIPQNGKKLVFRGDRIRLTEDGGVTEGRLY